MALRETGEDGLITDINVTPLVDITLVLLIIFMVTAKLIVSQDNKALPFDLPKAASGKDVQLIFGLELRASGETSVNGTPLPNDEVVQSMAKEALAKNPELRAVIKADAPVPHGRVIHALDMLQQAGLSKIAFAISPTAAASGSATAVPAAPR